VPMGIIRITDNGIAFRIENRNHIALQIQNRTVFILFSPLKSQLSE